MFVPPPPKPQPPNEVKGIFGDQALIGDKWYQVGDTIPPGAKVSAIEATLIKIEWEGKEMILAPIKAASSQGPQIERKKKRISVKEAQKQEAVAQEEVKEEGTDQGQDDDLAWLDVPAALKDKFRPYWNKMTAEQKDKAKEQWNNMTDEQKQQVINNEWSKL